MSLILEGVNLPKKDEYLSISVLDDGGVFIATSCSQEIKEARAIQIPKDHGQIGDLDIAIKNIEETISYVKEELKEYEAAENKDDYVDDYDTRMINAMGGLISAQVDVALTPVILEKEEVNG